MGGRDDIAHMRLPKADNVAFVNRLTYKQRRGHAKSH
jgi:hypothetical protein